jgi:hypothetical protein
MHKIQRSVAQRAWRVFASSVERGLASFSDLLDPSMTFSLAR